MTLPCNPQPGGREACPSWRGALYPAAPPRLLAGRDTCFNLKSCQTVALSGPCMLRQPCGALESLAVQTAASLCGTARPDGEGVTAAARHGQRFCSPPEIAAIASTCFHCVASLRASCCASRALPSDLYAATSTLLLGSPGRCPPTCSHPTLLIRGGCQMQCWGHVAFAFTVCIIRF